MNQFFISRFLTPFNSTVKKTFLAFLVGVAVCDGGGAFAEPTRLERVLNNKELRACIWPEYYSITYRNPKTRELSGIDIAITQELAKELGVRIALCRQQFFPVV
jgi:ABC-type amino acid transport substrate-binding protein